MTRKAAIISLLAAPLYSQNSTGNLLNIRPLDLRLSFEFPETQDENSIGLSVRHKGRVETVTVKEILDALGGKTK